MVKRLVATVGVVLVGLIGAAAGDDPAPPPPPDPLPDVLDSARAEASGFAGESTSEWTPVDVPIFDRDNDGDGVLDQDVEDEGGYGDLRWLLDLPTLDDTKAIDGEEIAGGGQPVAGPVLVRAAPTADPMPDDLGFLDVVLVGGADHGHCSGVLVAPDAVLTAAHCVPASQIVVGHRATRAFVRVAVDDTVVHPTLDAAVLRLSRPLPLPIRPRRRAGRQPLPVGVVRMVGFGVDDARHPSSFGVKRRVDASVDGWGCDRGRARTTGCRPGAELVLAAVGGGDTCYGDSGGPVLEQHDGVFRLLAITSRPTASGGAVCGRGGIYVRADALDPWLTPLLEARR